MKSGDVFECACGRKQPYAPAEEPNGVTEGEAFQMGWTFDVSPPRLGAAELRWSCPICSGNQLALFRYMHGSELDYGRSKPEPVCGCGRPLADHHWIEIFGNVWWSKLQMIPKAAFFGDIGWKIVLVFGALRMSQSMRVWFWIMALGLAQFLWAVTYFAVQWVWRREKRKKR